MLAKVEKGFALSSSEELVACACSNGLVKLIFVRELENAGVLSYWMAEQCHFDKDGCCVKKFNEKDSRSKAYPPDALACQFLKSEKIAVVYADHSLYIWDIHDMNKATRCCMLVSHSTSIWDIKNLCCENLHDPALVCIARGCPGGTSFATCSADGTIRLWDFLSDPEFSVGAAYSQTLDSKLGGTTNLVSSGIFERDTIEPGTVNGFRSLAVSSDGVYLAAGDCSGNLHIYNLQSSEYTCLEGAHDAEILSLGFNSCNKNEVVSGMKDNNYLLASAGRDRIIHVYDVKRNFDLIQSIVDHSAAVTSVKLTGDGHRLVSCSADRSLVVRDVIETEDNYNISRCHHQVASSGTVYDMVLDPSTNIAVTVGQDKKINTFDIASGQLTRSFKPNKDFGDPIKVNMDPSCSYLVCSYSNKSICIYDFVNGEMVTQAAGHSEVITGVIFLPDCKHIISVGGDGCIFVWKLPDHLTLRMLEAIALKSGSLSRPETSNWEKAFTRIVEFEQQKLGIQNGEMVPHNFNQTRRMHCIEESCQGNPRFKFRVSLLPQWAQAKVIDSQCSEVVPFEDIQTPHKTDPGESGELCITNISGRSGIDGSDTSPMIQRNSNVPFADNRWLSVYTVFMDSRDSPVAWGPKDDNILFSSPFETSTRIQRGNGYPQFHGPPISECSVPNERSKNYEVQVSSDDLHTKFEESDLFKEHFGNLSTSHKIDRRESSARRRYSSHFTVRRNCLGYHKKLIESPGLILGQKSFYYHTEPVNLPGNCFLEDPSNLNHKLRTTETSDREHQPPENQMGNLIVSPHEGKLHEKIDECSKALHYLENAAEATSRLLSELLAVVTEDELSRGPAAQLIINAAERLPSISEKVNKLMTLALVQRPIVKAVAVSQPLP
ncbi:hypothetical protein SAY87_000583 [Trapa incisa]|uniref:MABP1/WDR62 second WD40 domain-containing protein n=1 Tax=Trapa incisa TaxID=236973 RepID=A0AAN7JGR0_9MYRT|nr:hypothetical protein SAY87_000583 [Trapa incisa]